MELLHRTGGLLVAGLVSSTVSRLQNWIGIANNSIALVRIEKPRVGML